MLVVGFPTGALQANCYLVAPGKGEACVIVDPGQDAEEAIAQAVLAHSSVRTAANVLARLNLAFADAVIAFYEAKYHYRIWRPISAIPNWNSLGTTPPDPSYPGAHSVISQAAATILRYLVGQRQVLTVTSEALPGTVRHFTTFQQAADEAGLSRIYGGVHTRIDHVAGQQLGLDVARLVLR
ncbi:phosphatase PAP2 family protein [Kibdelosporangium lantanae]|uniref:Phosphatase PAP2 family protein n=1 Tax=Kibdelosporangium lantanae TaxID=1497396 RepID=A0ABW3MBW4_9PSEU